MIDPAQPAHRKIAVQAAGQIMEKSVCARRAASAIANRGEATKRYKSLQFWRREQASIGVGTTKRYKTLQLLRCNL
jgi:hypothetical protein